MTTATASPTQWRNIRFEVLEKVESLPSLNCVVLEFLNLAKQEFFTAKDFEAILSKDQALVARLLKIANSGLYGRSRSVNSIPEAVVLIGLDSLKKIVYSVSAEGLTCQELNHFDYHPDQGFWHHAMGVGQATRIVAEASPVCPLHGEEGFVAGLLHDVGKLIIDGFLETPRGVKVDLEDEIATVGMDHAELAKYLMRQWSLPDSITNAVRYHHEYEAAGPWVTSAAALALAQGICGFWNIGRTAGLDLSEEVPYSPFLEVMEVLGIKTNQWEQIIWDLRQSLTQNDTLFASGD